MLSFKQYLEESRLKAQDGESELVYHSTGADFKRFRPLSHFGTKDAARTIASYKGSSLEDSPRPPQTRGRLKYTGNQSYHHTARIRLGNVVDIDDFGSDHHPIDVLNDVKAKGHISDEQYKTLETNGVQLHRVM